MKKLLVFLIIFPIFVSAQFNPKSESYKYVKVDKELRDYFQQLRDFYMINGVDIDYRKIRAVRLRDKMIDENGNSLAGYYREDNVILIRGYHPNATINNIYDKIMLATLAHEIGHSQGLLHDTIDIDNLMYRSNYYVYDNLLSGRKTLTEILLSPYKK